MYAPRAYDSGGYDGYAKRDVATVGAAGVWGRCRRHGDISGMATTAQAAVRGGDDECFGCLGSYCSESVYVGLIEQLG